MSQLDRYITVLVGQQAERLDFVEGEPVSLHRQGISRPVTKQPLTGPQILMLVREVAPPEAVEAIAAGAAAAFRYQAPDAGVHLRVSSEGGRVAVQVEREGGGVGRPTPAAVSLGVTRPGDELAAVAAHATGSRPVVPAAAGAQVSVREESVNPAAFAEMERMLRQLVDRKASDLHLRVGEPGIIRESGEMMRVTDRGTFENAELEAMLLSIMPERNRKEFAQTNDTDFAYEIEDCARFRANVLKDRKGIAAVFRVIPSQVVNVEQMGVTAEVQQLCYLTKGLVLVTGPTGSGKSTTLCSLIDLVNRSRSDHVITIEDPIEFVHPNKKCIITQRQVGVHTNSFKSALRAALREDPDIILVGELRDLETVSIAIETAETGHLVFGTLHTTTAPGTIDRIIDQFPADRQEQIRVMLAESLKGVISQTLCKKIGGGRVAAREILLSVPAVSNLIREGKTFQIPSVMQTSRRLGMITLNDALIDLVDGNLVEPKEAYMKAIDKPNFLNMLRTRNHDVGFLEPEKSAEGAAPTSRPGTGGAPPASGRPVAGARK